MPPRGRRPVIVDAEIVEPDKPARKWDMDLDELDAQVTEAIGSAPAFTMRLRNGDVVCVRPAFLLTDERTTEWLRVQNDEDLDPAENAGLRTELGTFLDAETLERVWKTVEPHVRTVGRTISGEPAPPQHIRLAKAILGEEDYARVIAGGGSAWRIMWAFGQLNDAVPNAEADDPKSLKSSQ